MAFIEFPLGQNIIKEYKLTAGKNGANVRVAPGTSAPILITKKANEYIGRPSGIAIDDTNTENIWIKVAVGSNKIGYISKTVIKKEYPTFDSAMTAEFLSTYADAASKQKIKQAILNTVIKNDKEIFIRTLASAKNIEKLKAKGINVDKETATLKGLAQRFNARQKFIKDNTKSYQLGTWDSIKKGYGDLINWFGLGYTNRQFTGLGVIPIIVLVVCVVLAIAATAANIYALQPKYEEGKKDLKISEDLEKALNTLDPKTREAVVKNLETQIDDAYNAGKKNEWWKDKGGLIKNVALIGGGVLLVTWAIPKATAVTKRNYAA